MSHPVVNIPATALWAAGIERDFLDETPGAAPDCTIVHRDGLSIMAQANYSDDAPWLVQLPSGYRYGFVTKADAGRFQALFRGALGLCWVDGKPFDDGDVVGIDDDGCVVIWNAETRQSQNNGVVLAELGTHMLTDRERKRLGLPADPPCVSSLTGTHVVFDYPYYMVTPNYAAHRGQEVLVLGPVPDNEANGPYQWSEQMFHIRAHDGWEGMAWISELSTPGALTPWLLGHGGAP